MKYLEFFEVDLDGKTFLFKEQQEVYEFWNDKDTQNYALYNGGTAVYEKSELKDRIEEFHLSEAAKELIDSIHK